MYSFLLVVALASCSFVAALDDNNNTNTSCDAPRQKFLNNFLYIEKERSFAHIIAQSKKSDWLRTGQLAGWRQLPLFYEENSANSAFSFFYLLAGNFTADEAWTACQKFGGGYLANLNTLTRINFINKHLVRGDYWFGLSRWDGCNSWSWSSGFGMTKECANNWIDGQPKAAGLGYDCVRSVDPVSLNCTAGSCFANENAGWTTEKCDTTGFSALCESTYAKPFYGMIAGNFDFKGADAQCKAQFGQFSGSGLAMPNSYYELNNLIWETTIWRQGWECWLGNQRIAEKDYWKHQFLDGAWATRFSYQPRVYGRNYSMWSDSQTCVSLYDPTFSKSRGFEEKAFYNYNDCSFKLTCAICQWFYPLA
jgi:hypothetical protein